MWLVACFWNLFRSFVYALLKRREGEGYQLIYLKKIISTFQKAVFFSELLSTGFEYYRHTSCRSSVYNKILKVFFWILNKESFRFFSKWAQLWLLVIKSLRKFVFNVWKKKFFSSIHNFHLQTSQFRRSKNFFLS